MTKRTRASFVIDTEPAEHREEETKHPVHGSTNSISKIVYLFTGYFLFCRLHCNIVSKHLN